MVPFSSLFLLDSATLSFASMATVVYGYVTLRSFACWACALHFVVVPFKFGLFTHPVAFYLSVCLRLYLLVGILKQSGFLVCLRDFFFALIGGSLWALFTPGLCFLVFPVLSSSAWFVGCDGAKLWFTAVDSAVLVMLLSSVYLSASASADFVDLDQLGILEACLLSVLVGVIFFSSRPNKASTAGMSAGNRNIGLNLLLERMSCICCMLWIFVALFQFAVNRFASSLLLLSEDWDCLIFFLSSMELWLQMEAYVDLFCSAFSSLIFWCSNAFNIGSCGGIRVIWVRPSAKPC